MQHKVIIRDDLTIASCGYSIKDLPNGSHKFIIVECTNCNRLIRREFRNRTRLHQCPIVIGNKKRCYSCKLWKDFSLFNKNGQLSGGVSKLCRECYNSHDVVRSLETRRAKRLKDATKEGDYKYYITRRMGRRKNKTIHDGKVWDLDINYLIDLWEKQNGLCYYSSIPMVGSGTGRGLPSWNSPSLDRLDPSKGYVVNNVSWCLYSINSFKGELTEKQFLDVIKLIKWKV